MISRVYCVIITYLVLFILCGGIYYLKKRVFLNVSDDANLEKNYSRFLPFDIIKDLKQLFYIGIVFLLIMDMIFILFFNQTALLEVLFFDIIISFIVIISLIDKSYIKIIAVFLLLPVDSIVILLMGVTSNYQNIFIVFTLLRFIGNLYAIIYFNYKFINYTEKHNLSLTIVIFVILIVVCAFITMFYENVSPLDGFLMASNAFTTSGYAAPGDSVFGKLADLLLIWGGYLFSTIGTATLTVAILHKKLINRDNNKINQLNRKVDDLNDKIDHLTKIIDEKQ